MRGKKPKKNLADYYKEKYSKSLSEAKATNTDENTIDALNLNLGKYTLKSHISRSPWLKSGRPATKAIKWLYQEVFKNPDYFTVFKIKIMVKWVFVQKSIDYINFQIRMFFYVF